MFVAFVPHGFIRVGTGTFTVEGPTREVAAIRAKFADAAGTMELVHQTMLAGLEGDHELLATVGQLVRPGLAYTINGEPVSTGRNAWSVPFTAYVYERGQ